MKYDLNDPDLLDKQIRAATFKKVSSDIVSKDRELRKFGCSVNTGGEIKAALERAYKLGMAHGKLEDNEMAQRPRKSESPSDEEEINWLTIPKRARDAFYSVVNCRYLVIHQSQPYDVPGIPREQWGLYFPNADKPVYSRSIAISTMDILIRMGLMEIYQADDFRALTITRKAVTTWNKAVDEGYINQKHIEKW